MAVGFNFKTYSRGGKQTQESGDLGPKRGAALPVSEFASILDPSVMVQNEGHLTEISATSGRGVTELLLTQEMFVEC